MINTAVIPVAGLGTRMLPATKAIPKEMLPIIDKPLIQYIVEECALSGITNIVLVTHSSKNSIEDHFDVSFELESTLEKRVKRSLLQEVQSIVPPNISIMHIRQGKPFGLGHAILIGKKIVGKKPFAVVLPDVLINRFDCDLSNSNLHDMINRFNETGLSQVMVEPIDNKLSDQYGIADINGQQIEAGDTAKISKIIEKPHFSAAPSNLAVVGRYVFSESIWDMLEVTPLGIGNEIQLTDAIEMLLNHEAIEAYRIIGKSHDCGSKESYFLTNVEYLLRSERYGKDFSSKASALIKEYST